VLRVFAGLRPLDAQKDGQKQDTKEISRIHRLKVSLSGLITITGGNRPSERQMYDSDRDSINGITKAEPDLGKRLHPDCEYTCDHSVSSGIFIQFPMIRD
jgi:glycerol-3-phosphate dehydrogenase